MKSTKNRNLIVIWTIDIDQSSSDVIDWLISKKQNYVRIDSYEKIEINTISLNRKSTNINFTYKTSSFNTNTIKSFWYRKGEIKSGLSLNRVLDKTIEWYLKEESKAVMVFLQAELEKKAKINGFKNCDINKLTQLVTAKENNLNIPNTIVSNNPKIVKEFLAINSSNISKSIQVPFFLQKNDKVFTLFTNDFLVEDLNVLGKNFFLTKFQNKIIKQFEIRSFYIDKQFFSMAIFSQNNPKTSTDFRNYDREKPNRTTPFNLPKSIENKLRKIMEKLSLNSGSIDMIVDINNKFYFLEINPVGQFGMVSKPCNYFLEKKIADILINK